MFPGGAPAEGEIRELARERGEILALGDPADFQVHEAVEIFLLIPELRPAPGLIATIELLHLLQGLQIGIAAQVISVAVGDCQLECRLLEARTASRDRASPKNVI